MEFTAIRSPAAGRTSEHDGGGPSSTTDQVQVEKEHMFDKVVTPSDVGKLNRLVIPKQHAEKYFPLDSTTAAAASTGGGGGLLLSFEDRTGKPWRFRYSYWNSSQSYVMTKGWSRFVKEKRLDAGDTVSFGRGVGSEAAKGRLFIDWRRRPDNSMASAALPPYAGRRFTALIPNSVPFAPWTMPARAQQQGQHPFFSGSGGRAAAFVPQPPPSFVYDDGCYGAAPGGHGGGRQVLYYRPQQQQHAAVVLESVPVRMGMAAMAAAAAVPSSGTKRVRLFGVNLDSEEEDSNYSRPALSTMQLMSPASSTSTSSSSAGKARCSLNLDL